MKKKKIAVIGTGGRTGTMFTFEFKKVADILGVGKETETINQRKLLVQRKRKNAEIFEGRVISPSQWLPDDFLPEIIFLTTKRPVSNIVKYYYKKIKEKGFTPPILVLSQNGISVGKEALSSLTEVFGTESQKIKIVRLSLFNPIDKEKKDDRVFVNYSLPIRFVFAKFSGPGNLKDLTVLFQKAGFAFKEFSSKKVREMEMTKLFLNLIGMASATLNFSTEQGLKRKEIFEEEIKALKEYIRVVKASGEEFLNFPHYPVRLSSSLIDILPTEFFLPFRNYFAKIIAQGREGKPKDLAEIKYYNGVVVHLGKKNKIATPINQRIIQRVLK